jgi:calcineurin-like phosphoesterase family protein
LSNDINWVLTAYGKNRIVDTNTIWFTSDTHFFHENVIKYCSRPYQNIEEMNSKLIDNWNSCVKKNDIVWHLGDFSFGSKDNIRKILPRLNGRIRLIKGNHDRHNNMFYIDQGFDRVYDRPIIIDTNLILLQLQQMMKESQEESLI